MKELTLVHAFDHNSNKIPATTSKIVAESFGKEHRRVLQDIREHIIPHQSEDTGIIVVEDTVETPAGFTTKQTTIYHLSNEAVMLLVMGYTGAPAMKVKKEFIRQFRKMKEYLMQQNTKPIDPNLALTQLAEGVLKLQKENLKLDTRNTRLTANLDKSRATARKRLAAKKDLAEKLAKNRAKMKELRDDLKVSKDKQSKLKRELINLKARQEDAIKTEDTELSSYLKEEIQQKTLEMNVLRDQVNDFDIALKVKDDEINTLIKDMENKDQQIDEMRVTVSDLHLKTQDQANALIKNKTELTRLRKEKQELTRKADLLESGKLDKLQSKYENLIKETEAKERRIKDLEGDRGTKNIQNDIKAPASGQSRLGVSSDWDIKTDGILPRSYTKTVVSHNSFYNRSNYNSGFYSGMFQIEGTTFGIAGVYTRNKSYIQLSESVNSAFINKKFCSIGVKFLTFGPYLIIINYTDDGKPETYSVLKK